MNKTTLKNFKPKAGIFIDDSNLFFSQKKAGWKVDLGKFKKLLEKEVKIIMFRYYLAVPAKWDKNYSQTQGYIEKIIKHATIKTKPVKYIRLEGSLIKKGDVDVEIVLDVVRNLSKLDLIIIVSGDSDYLELRNFVLENEKQILFVGFKRNMAWELKRGKYLLFEKLQKFVELNKKTPRYYPGRVLLPILYQKRSIKSRKKL